MKIIGTILEKRSPRKTTKFQQRNGGQKTDLQSARVKSNGVQRVLTTTWKKQASIVLSTKTQKYSPFSESYQAYCSNG